MVQTMQLCPVCNIREGNQKSPYAWGFLSSMSVCPSCAELIHNTWKRYTLRPIPLNLSELPLFPEIEISLGLCNTRNIISVVRHLDAVGRGYWEVEAERPGTSPASLGDDLTDHGFNRGETVIELKPVLGITKKLQSSEYEDMMTEVFQYAVDSPRTGFHIHVPVLDLPAQKMAMVWAWFLLNEDKLFSRYPERKTNKFCLEASASQMTNVFRYLKNPLGKSAMVNFLSYANGTTPLSKIDFDLTWLQRSLLGRPKIGKFHSVSVEPLFHYGSLELRTWSCNSKDDVIGALGTTREILGTIPSYHRIVELFEQRGYTCE